MNLEESRQWAKDKEKERLKNYKCTDETHWFCKNEKRNNRPKSE